jgi:hypothetical protein
MQSASGRRPPEAADLLLIFAELAKRRVEYALLGGAAMALHGFPRMTKDIDLILPRDPANNARLLTALKTLGTSLRIDHLPAKKTLDGGFSTAAEGELGIDLLFVAASKTFEDYRGHIIDRVVDGVPVRMLDVDGMLMSKQTDRPEDIADHQRLQRLKSGK